VINEIAWAGTLASSYDEWIELRNTTSHSISLSGWTLSDSGDINVHLSGSVPPHGYFLLERSDDGTIRDLPAQQIYTGSLHNSGERLRLRDPSGSLIDTANGAGGAWPAGDSATRSSMERRGYNDSWTTFSGSSGVGHDADGNPIQGSPGMPNSPWIPTPIPGASETPTPTPTPTPSATPADPGDPFPEGSVLIHEIAWAGTLASSADEWIELYNPGERSINLQDWRLSDGSDIQISLQGSIAPKMYYLLERSDDRSVADIPADHVYSGTLSNAGEILTLRDPIGKVIDCANPKGRAWPAGERSSRASMERIGGQGSTATWGTFNGHHGSGHDVNGNLIQGTPLSQNSVQFPPPPPMWIKGKIVINEVLIRPHFDWEGKGGVDPGDEFIELLNLGPLPVFLKGWILDDVAQGGSSPYTLPGISLRPGSYVALFRNQTRLALNDGGDSVRLITPDGQLVDKISYLKVRAYNLSYGRLPDGSGNFRYGLWPTPGEPNEIFFEGGIPITSLGPCICTIPGEDIPLRSHFPLRAPWANLVGLCVH